ncbi:hypothetical protein AB0L44_37325 [Nonomuraea wenchangensis]|uniref:hypothetical protein n=1 Tax=Nonomuraea wenchangensis TaxID=568860 RepID=UPI003441AF1C
MFTYELQRRLAPHGTTVAVAAHPGMSSTELNRNAPAAFRPPTRRARRPVLRPRRAVRDHGPPRPVTSCSESYDVAVQWRLWVVSEDLTGVTFPVAAPASGAAVRA